jgi:hypothetical protein
VGVRSRRIERGATLQATRQLSEVPADPTSMHLSAVNYQDVHHRRDDEAYADEGAMAVIELSSGVPCTVLRV